jgi:two-component system phosphate regulon response regulator PhoB
VTPPTHHILIVDDVATLATVLRMRLEASGYEVSVAVDGEDALRQTRARRPDLVILDLALPGIQGEDVCRALRRDPALARLPILILSARIGEPERRRVLAAGADAFFMKPYELAPLLDEIRARLERAGGASAA